MNTLLTLKYIINDFKSIENRKIDKNNYNEDYIIYALSKFHLGKVNEYVKLINNYINNKDKQIVIKYIIIDIIYSIIKIKLFYSEKYNTIKHIDDLAKYLGLNKKSINNLIIQYNNVNINNNIIKENRKKDITIFETNYIYETYNLIDKYYKKDIPFLLIDSKSLPRSGFHYLKNKLSSIFKEHFTWCEWYNDPGCCKKQPCGLFSFLKDSIINNKLNLRLIKSHDFSFIDNNYLGNRLINRIILIRDPLYILTSWFVLDLIHYHNDMLIKYNINEKKINYLHENSLVNEAYIIISKNIKEISFEYLNNSINKKVNYISRFIEKWCINNTTSEHTKIINYKSIDDYIINLIDKFSKYDNTIKYNDIIKFKKRENAFIGPTDVITDILNKYKKCFENAAENIQSKYNDIF